MKCDSGSPVWQIKVYGLIRCQKTEQQFNIPWDKVLYLRNPHSGNHFIFFNNCKVDSTNILDGFMPSTSNFCASRACFNFCSGAPAYHPA